MRLILGAGVVVVAHQLVTVVAGAAQVMEVEVVVAINLTRSTQTRCRELAAPRHVLRAG